MLEYEIYVPARGHKKLFQDIKRQLIGFFGGLTDTRSRNIGCWKCGDAVYLDEILVWKVLSTKGISGERFVKQLAKKLQRELRQKSILVIKRKVTTLDISGK